MAKANQFVEALRGARAGVETVAEARLRQRTEWLEDLNELCAAVRAWLAPVIEANFATVTPREVLLTEPDLGEYTASGLEITLIVSGQTRAVLLRPRGMRIVGIVDDGGARITGARGRVDLECGASRAILLRFKNDVVAWVSFSSGERRVVTEEVFFDLLANVTGLPLG